MTTTYAVAVRLREGMVFDGEAEPGFRVVLDSSPETGGQNLGFRPMQLLLVSLGGCTGMDVIAMLRKMRQDVTDYQVIVTAERAEEHPRVFTAIDVEHIVAGHDLAEESVRRAVELSATRYCPVSAMLSKAARLEHRYRVIGAAQPAAQPDS